jgi:hypothetical protein
MQVISVLLICFFGIPLAQSGIEIGELGKLKMKGVCMMEKQKRKADDPIIAEGINTEDELMKNASTEEIEKGEYTNVTTLSLDENDPS